MRIVKCSILQSYSPIEKPQSYSPVPGLQSCSPVQDSRSYSPIENLQSCSPISKQQQTGKDTKEIVTNCDSDNPEATEERYTLSHENSPSNSASYEPINSNIKNFESCPQFTRKLELIRSSNSVETQMLSFDQSEDSLGTTCGEVHDSHLALVLDSSTCTKITSTFGLQQRLTAAQINLKSITSQPENFDSSKFIPKTFTAQSMDNQAPLKQTVINSLQENLVETSTREIFIEDASHRMMSTPSALSESSERASMTRELSWDKNFRESSTRLSNDDEYGCESSVIIDDTAILKTQEKQQLISKPKVKAKKAPENSPYFGLPSELCNRNKLQKRSFISRSWSGASLPFKDRHVEYAPHSTGACIPFPPLSSPHFGLIQERLADDPFRLLIATTFLTRTHGKHAIPVFYMLMTRYPTPDSLLAAPKEDIVSMIRHLGFQNQHATTYQNYASIWLHNPPVKGKRYAVRGYPSRLSARNVRTGEVLTDADARDAWEIGHMTCGPYTLDSWRIFCRDKLRGLAEGWNGEGAREDFQPEWMRVRPDDKELKAFLRWMWLKEGFIWDPLTGEKEVADQNILAAAMDGLIVCDNMGRMRVVEGVVECGNDLNNPSEKDQCAGLA
ncbi:hypothetical protein K3495_g2667 [Podosphaera aphanis]|nr:hypothetical protein K3495_g2667 [Podosphaera aphanis]